MELTDFIGQETVKKYFDSALRNERIGHAYAFAGPAGIGKSSFARLLAKALLCFEPDGLKPCGKCRPCSLMDAGTNPDFYSIDTEGNSILVDEIRNLEEDIIIRPMYSRHKVYLIKNAERMTEQAQNCLLKTLESPPGQAVIILTVSNFNSLIETIRSRVVRLNFRKLSDGEIAHLLKVKASVPADSNGFIVTYADGIPGRALELALSQDFPALRERTVEIALQACQNPLSEVLRYCRFFDDNRERIDTVLSIMEYFFRDMLLAKTGASENLLINYDKKDIIINSVSKFTAAKLAANIDLLENTRRLIKQNANFQLATVVMLMELQEDRFNDKSSRSKV